MGSSDQEGVMYQVQFRGLSTAFLPIGCPPFETDTEAHAHIQERVEAFGMRRDEYRVVKVPVQDAQLLDQKDAKIKTALGKVPLNLLPLSALKGAARVFGYGAKKYALGNFHTADDSEIANRYVGGCLRHLADCQRPDGLFDWNSVAALDKESGLPELDHAICGLLMLRALAVKHGALPADPGEGNDP